MLFFEIMCKKALPVTTSYLYFSEITFKAFKSEGNIKKMKEADKAKTDEAFRDSTKFSEEMLGMPGSFKMLSVD